MSQSIRSKFSFLILSKAAKPSSASDIWWDLSSSERNYFGQDGTEGNGYTTLTLVVNGDSFTGTTVRTGSWALSDEWGDITYQIWDNFAYASNYEDMQWEVTHN